MFKHTYESLELRIQNNERYIPLVQTRIEDKYATKIQMEELKMLDKLQQFKDDLAHNKISKDKYEETKTQEEAKLNKSIQTYQLKIDKAVNKEIKTVQRDISRLKTRQSKTKRITCTNQNNDQNILEIKNLTMQFGGLKAVNELSFNVKRGEVFGLIGPNGAGKTTVFNCITQFYPATSGSINFINRNNQVIDLKKIKVHNVIKQGIVRTFQNVELIWELSILDNMRVAAHTRYESTLYDQFAHSKRLKREEYIIIARAMEVLERLDLLMYKDDIPLGLPYGILKKIELARTLMTNPQLIILDEPAAGLNDTETVELAMTIKQIQKDFDCTIFLVEHDMGLVMDICDTICAISFGKLLAYGAPSDIQQNKDVQEAYLGGE